MEFLNLTPHEIVIRNQKGGELRIPPSGQVARVETNEFPAGSVRGIPVVRRKAGRVTGLPEIKEPGVALLVSSMVLEALGEEAPVHVYAPDTGATAIRDEKGRIQAVTRLVAKK